VSAQRSYETSVARVEEIIRRLDSGEASLGETLELVREGRDLIEHCAGELESVGAALQELRLDELVARLEGGGGAARAPSGAPPGAQAPPGPREARGQAPPGSHAASGGAGGPA
jgi:exodeoxyribonuclease VII small subunit